jgi:hypothetical protein
MPRRGPILADIPLRDSNMDVAGGICAKVAIHVGHRFDPCPADMRLGT